MSGGWGPHRRITIKLVFIDLLAERTHAFACAMGDSAVFREGPPEELAELEAAHLQTHLAGEDEPLIGRQLAREKGHEAQLHAHHRQLLDSAAHVGDVGVGVTEAAGRERALPYRLPGTASRQRALAILYAREEAQLERGGGMTDLTEAAAGANVADELHAGLAEAFLQVGTAQRVAVGPEQPFAL